MKIYSLPYPDTTIKVVNAHMTRILNMSGHPKRPKYLLSLFQDITGSKFDGPIMVGYFGQKPTYSLMKCAYSMIIRRFFFSLDVFAKHKYV